MPTYTYTCSLCEETFELWRSMKADPLLTHDGCGGEVSKIYGPVRTLGVGAQGAGTQEIEAREARWSKDMPAYKRFRDKGHQPPGIDGCDYLEATAQNDLWIRSGGRIRVDEQRAWDAKAEAEDIMAGRL